MNEDLRALLANELQILDCRVTRAQAKRITNAMLGLVHEALKVAQSPSDRKDMNLKQIGLRKTSNEMQGNPKGVSKT